LDASRLEHPASSCSVANFGTAESKIAEMRRLKPNMKNALHQTKPSDSKILPLNPEFPFEVAKLSLLIIASALNPEKTGSQIF
jgi:hypothetical protein